MTEVEQIQLNIKLLKADGYDTVAKIQQLEREYRDVSKQLNEQLDGINKQIQSQEANLKVVQSKPVVTEQVLLEESK